MKILDDLIATLNQETSVRNIQQGLFFTGVLTRHCGLAATLPQDALHQKRPLVKEAGLLLEKSVPELVQMAYSESIAEAAIGMATINSLLEIDERYCHELNGGDLIARKGTGKRVAMIGHFPFTPKLRQITKELWVIEKNPLEDDLIETEAKNLLPKADVIGLTGTSITNHTLEHLLKICNPKAYVVILGGTAPLSSVLFDYGVHAIAGTKVVEPGLTLRCVSEGANFRQIKGTRRLIMMK